MTKKLTMKNKFPLLVMTVLVPFLVFYFPKKKTKLFLPDKKGEWHKWLVKTGREDPKNVFQFEDGMIHASGEDFGYMITEKKYGNFHLAIEFKWGEKKYPPREKEKRDAGIIYHANLYSGDKVWPRSLEYQVK